jgi:hypothetical protein
VDTGRAANPLPGAGGLRPSDPRQGQGAGVEGPGDGLPVAAQPTAPAGQARGEVAGTVARADARTLFLEDARGAVIPLKVDGKTRFEDAGVRSAADLRKGQQVRASFTVRGTDNWATRISLGDALGTGTGGGGTGGGGTGGQEPPPPQGLPDPDGPRPADPLDSEQPGTGGSGLLDVDPFEDPTDSPAPGGERPGEGTRRDEAAPDARPEEDGRPDGRGGAPTPEGPRG